MPHVDKKGTAGTGKGKARKGTMATRGPNENKDFATKASMADHCPVARSGKGGKMRKGY